MMMMHCLPFFIFHDPLLLLETKLQLSNNYCIIHIIQRTDCSILCYGTDIFRNYFKDHAHEFIDAPPLQGGEEHNLHYYSLFMDYLAIYEVCARKYFMSTSYYLYEYFFLYGAFICLDSIIS